jgi:hypothetical protein
MSPNVSSTSFKTSSMAATLATSLETGLFPSTTSPTPKHQPLRTCQRMSSTLSVGEFGWTRAPMYPLAPIFEFGSGLKTVWPTFVSSSLVMSLTIMPMTSLGRPIMTALISSSVLVSKKLLSSAIFQARTPSSAGLSVVSTIRS